MLQQSSTGASAGIGPLGLNAIPPQPTLDDSPLKPLTPSGTRLPASAAQQSNSPLSRQIDKDVEVRCFDPHRLGQMSCLWRQGYNRDLLTTDMARLTALEDVSLSTLDMQSSRLSTGAVEAENAADG